MTEQRATWRLVARVRGRVQGVGYRFFVRDRAKELGLTGSVQNLPNGSVRVEAEGRKDALTALLADLRQGPPGANVEGVDVEWLPPRGSAEFLIEAG
jgi:acylphosphatase